MTAASGSVEKAVTMATEGDQVDLEAVMLSQGDDDDDVYGKKYHMTPEDRTDRSAARAKQKEDGEKQEKERAALLKFNCENRSRSIKSRRHSRHC